MANFRRPKRSKRHTRMAGALFQPHVSLSKRIFGFEALTLLHYCLCPRSRLAFLNIFEDFGIRP